MKKITETELAVKLSAHKLWLETDRIDGERLCLMELDLSDVDLSGADLIGASDAGKK